MVDERAVCVVNYAGQWHAIADVCPHRGAALSEGHYRDGCLTCPAHLWRFSVVDGQKQGDPRTHVMVYPLRENEEGLQVYLPARVIERSLREVLLAHARGEDKNG